MTTPEEEAVGPVTVQIGVCSVCHALFLISGDRETSPCHGSDPLLVLATLVVDETRGVVGYWGPISPADAHEVKEELAPAPAPPAEPPAAEEEEGPPEGDPATYATVQVMHFVATPHDAPTAEELRVILQEAGAEPEAAATAVGRLSAVRELLEQLSAAREPAPVAPAPPEAEDSPENT